MSQGDDLGSAEHVGLRGSARALAGRRLLIVTRRQGRWQATITDAGRYYLEHGAFPPQTAAAPLSRSRMSPDSGTATAKPRPKGGRQPTAVTHLDPTELMTRISQAPDRILRIPHPDPPSRAAYRRAVHAARQRKLVPAEFSLLFTGRNSGDIVLHLAGQKDADRKKWASARYRARHEITAPDEIIAALGQGGWLNMVEEELHPAALDLCGALLAAGAGRGHQMVAATGSGIRLSLYMGQRRHDVFVRQEYDQVPHVATPTERRNASRDPWTFKIPEFDKVAAPRLELFMNHGHNERIRWGGIVAGNLGQRVRRVFGELEEQQRARQAAYEAWHREYEAEQEEARRRKEEQHLRWTAAMDQARTMAVDQLRADVFDNAFDSWLRAQQIRDFCAALQTMEANLPAGTTDLGRWAAWGQAIADEIDPTAGSTTLAEVPFDVTPGPDDLRPFLGNWSPFRPKMDRGATDQNAADDVVPPRRWHLGMRGRPSWWRP